MKARLNNTLLALLLTGALTAAGCADTAERTGETDTTATDTSIMGMDTGMGTTQMAVATLQPTQGNDVSGTVTFTEENGVVRVTANVSGLEQGQHGIHVHQNGDCSAPDASSAGDHFNPDNSPHGAPDDPPGQRHVGDLGNIEVFGPDAATLNLVDDVISLNGPNSIVGKAVIVHQNPDDLETQPSGDAGARLACGVIEMQDAGMQPGTPGAGADTTIGTP